MAEFKTDQRHDFDLEVVLDAFKKCRQNDGNLFLDEYLRAFHELCRWANIWPLCDVDNDGNGGCNYDDRVDDNGWDEKIVVVVGRSVVGKYKSCPF